MKRNLGKLGKLEKVNKKLKRKAKVVGAFPNERSLLKLKVAILHAINEEYLFGKIYLSMDY
ncbi:hypothetical protein XO09_00680 [Thermosipho sp. 1223]|nr:hypothetical protein [Thermosipho sp. 1244]OOC47502.1 hypothetical protein XO09_00680 [Thermosipho sp. 1223]